MSKKIGDVILDVNNISLSFDAAHVFDSVNDFQVALRVNKASIAGVVPAVLRQYFCGGGWVFVVFLQQPP